MGPSQNPGAMPRVGIRQDAGYFVSGVFVSGALSEGFSFLTSGRVSFLAMTFGALTFIVSVINLSSLSLPHGSR